MLWATGIHLAEKGDTMNTSRNRRYLRLLPAPGLAAGVLAVPAVMAGGPQAPACSDCVARLHPKGFRLVV